MAESVVVRPRPSGVRMTLLRRQLSQPLVLVSLLILAAGLARAFVSGSFPHGALSALVIPAFVVVLIVYLALYYRNVSCAVAGGQLLRTGLLGVKRGVPTSAIQRMVLLRVGVNHGGVSQVLVLGEGDRCLMIIGRSDEYPLSDLENLATASGTALVNGGTIDSQEFARRYPTAISGFGALVIATSRRPRLVQMLAVLVTILAFVIFGVVLAAAGHH